jgi:hypothetical protein
MPIDREPICVFLVLLKEQSEFMFVAYVRFILLLFVWMYEKLIVYFYSFG